MAPDATAVDGVDAEVMASVDAAPGRSELVIADVSRDDAWVSARADAVPRLSDWR
ncbi:hypothetical protein ACFO0N_17995 [Halobium salinum]|uniref:Uncharacterized protein n=1 Tax=Halobium salinum TaxID=1364940 RepID=A0ABD5PHB6_9EURY|nr:hypothetical protein [Halobium salinum]